MPDQHLPVTFAELHDEIARRDQRIEYWREANAALRADLVEVRAALAGVVEWWDAGDEPGAVRIAPRGMWARARASAGLPGRALTESARQEEAARRLVGIAEVLDLPAHGPIQRAAGALLDPAGLPGETQFVLALLVDTVLGRPVGPG